MSRPSTPASPPLSPPRSSTPQSFRRTMVTTFRGVVFGTQEVTTGQVADTILGAVQQVADIAPVPGLTECVELLDKVSQSVQKVQVQKKLCASLADKASEIVRILQDHVKDAEGQEAAKITWVQGEIVSTRGILASILEDLDEWIQAGKLHGWLDRNAIAEQIGAHVEAIDECRKNITMGCAVDAAEGITVIGKQVASLQQTLDTSAADSPQYKLAQKETLELRNVLTGDRALELPVSLGSQCKRVGGGAVKAGSTYDIWKGELNGEREVAMKLLRDVNAKSIDESKEKACGRFVREIKTWRTLDNKHVVKLHGWCTINDEFYLVSEWMRHGDIGAYLGKARCTPEEYIGFLLDILQGLKYLHSVDILHGALQPSNILIDKGKYAVLSDFALAKEVSPDSMNTFSNASAHHLRYQAPEVDDTTAMSIAGDVWAWAMTSLEIVSGRRPFQKFKTLTALVRAKANSANLPKLADYKCSTFSVYPGLWDILNSCWVDAGERPTVDALLHRVDVLRAQG